jgi:4-hydroxybenzoate polyprenyltransferase
MKNIVKIMRIEHWTKNLFVFLPIFFGGQLLNPSALLSCFVAFVAFSFAASSIYCFNDILDAQDDKTHPQKCKRPVASGAISKKTAYVLAMVCLAFSISVAYLFAANIMPLILIYCVINLAYCAKLKHFAIIDAVIISMGFVLRILTGSIASGIEPSEWIIIMTFLLALFLAFAKRRDDVVLRQSTGVSPRKNTSQYNLEFMNQVITIVATITIVAYVMYTLSPNVIERFNTEYVYITAIFVLMGIIRYLQITIVEQKSGSPEKILLNDRFIQFCILGWLLSFIAIIYLDVF